MYVVLLFCFVMAFCHGKSAMIFLMGKRKCLLNLSILAAKIPDATSCLVKSCLIFLRNNNSEPAVNHSHISWHFVPQQQESRDLMGGPAEQKAYLTLPFPYLSHFH